MLTSLPLGKKGDGALANKTLTLVNINAENKKIYFSKNSDGA